jgi:hypothetical protein
LVPGLAHNDTQPFAELCIIRWLESIPNLRVIASEPRSLFCRIPSPPDPQALNPAHPWPYSRFSCWLLVVGALVILSSTRRQARWMKRCRGGGGDREDESRVGVKMLGGEVLSSARLRPGRWSGSGCGDREDGGSVGTILDMLPFRRKGPSALGRRGHIGWDSGVGSHSLLPPRIQPNPQPLA